MPVLVPSPNTLGLFSPVLGPWFDTAAVTLGAPAADLSVALPNLTATALPPAAGTLALYMVTTTRHPNLATLRRADGTAAFTNGNMVALYRLLPEVESRLHALTANIPAASGAPVGMPPTRPRVRHIAFEFPPPATIAALQAMMHGGFTLPEGVSSPTDIAQHLGLQFDINTSTWSNGLTPMNDMFRPGELNGSFAELLRFTAVNVNLWSFDSRGRPLDPGAVADWWSFLAVAAGFNAPNLWEGSLQAANRRTAPVVAQRTVHLVSAHEGPLDPTTRARVTPNNLTAVGASDHVFVAGAGPSVAFTPAPAAPAADDLPLPLAAVLPEGRYAATATPWAGGAIAALTRDFCRIAVVSVEHQLVGQDSHWVAPASPTDADTKRARRSALQRDPATRVSPDRVATPVLLDTHEQVLAAVPTIFAAGPAPRELVTSQLDRGFGPLPALPAPPAPLVPPLPQVPLPPVGLPAVALPGQVLSVVAHHLAHTTATVVGGASPGTIVLGQRALLTITFDAVITGAWVRGWTQGFDPAKGERYHLDGGAGMVQGDTVSLVVDLQDGKQEPDAQMGVDIIVVTGLGTRLFGDLRFPRPGPTSDPLFDFANLTGADTLLCEFGPVPLPGSPPTNPPLAGSLPSGCNLVVVTDPTTPRLVDPATIPANVHAPTAIINQLANTDRIELTDNAFARTPTGEPDAPFTTIVGAGNLHRQGRALLNGWQAGFPLHGMERHELVLANPGAGMALVGATPALARYHERLHHRHGHPLCPATTDLHATGALLTGPGALSVLEYSRDRTAGSTPELADAASTALPVPAAPAAPSGWAVGLRTVGAGVEAELGLPALLDLLGGGDTFTTQWTTAVNWWNGLVPAPITLTGNELGDAPRALDRRILAARGLREGATSMLAAIRRAEDFIYIETPALDNLVLGAPDDTLQLWQALIDRMDAAPGLRVILCVPVHLLPGAPKALQRVRDSLLIKACDALTGSALRAVRFARFSPAAGPGRSLRIASTTVIVDDAYAITGTTHLWRRGLSFDSSLAVAVFDDNLSLGRPADIVGFRRRLLAGRLGIHLADLPEDPAEVVVAIRTLQARGGFGSLAIASIPQPDPTGTLTQNPIVTDEDAWNPDGSLQLGFSPANLLASLMANDVTDEFNVPTP